MTDLLSSLGCVLNRLQGGHLVCSVHLSYLPTHTGQCTSSDAAIAVHRASISHRLSDFSNSQWCGSEWISHWIMQRHSLLSSPDSLPAVCLDSPSWRWTLRWWTPVSILSRLNVSPPNPIRLRDLRTREMRGNDEDSDVVKGS